MPKALAFLGRFLSALGAAITDVRDGAAVGEQLVPGYVTLLQGIEDPLLVAPCPADHEDLAVLSLLDVQARVVVVVGWADSPEAVVTFLVAIHDREDLFHRPHALSLSAPPGRAIKTA
jgi:hypothetical protein